VTKKEKKQIRLQIIELLDTYCGPCNERHHSMKSACLTTCSVGKQMRQLSSQLEEKQICYVTVKGKKQGKWNDEETFYLWNHRHMPIRRLAEKLNRDQKSVYNKLWRLKKKGGIQHVS
jgi:Zinc-finger